MIRAVTFDVGGTLIEPWPSVGHVYADVAAQHGLKEVSVERLNRQFAAAWRSHTNFGHTKAEWAGIVDATFAGLMKSPPSRTFFPELYERFAQAGAWRVFEDVLPTLEALRRRGLKIGVISNWDERLRPLLRMLSLSDWFEATVVSCEVGVCKPSGGIFKSAADRIGFDPEEMLHVGDSSEQDVAGAEAAGFKALRVVRHGVVASGNEIATLAELAGKL